MYCGNNRYDLGVQQRGTPYTCLRKGIGQGLVSDLTHFNPQYDPIIPDKTWCGTKTPPAGKHWGTPMSCLRKGFGLGQMLQYERSEPYEQSEPFEQSEHIIESYQESSRPSSVLKIAIWIALAFLIFMVIFQTVNKEKDGWLMLFVFVLMSTCFVTLWIVL